MENAYVKASQGVTFGQVADAYIASLRIRITTGSFRASTLNTYINIIETDLRPIWGDDPIRRLTRADITDYRARLTDPRPGGQHAEPDARDRPRHLRPGGREL